MQQQREDSDLCSVNHENVGLYKISPGTVFEDGFVILTNEQLETIPRSERKKYNKRLRLEVSKRNRHEKRIACRIKAKQVRRSLHEQGIALPPPKINHNPIASGVQVLIDLDFEGLMGLKDLKSLVRQIKRCYSTNRQQPISLELLATGMSQEFLDQISKQIAGFRNWDKFPFYEKKFQDMLQAGNNQEEEHFSEGGMIDTQIPGLDVPSPDHLNLMANNDLPVFTPANLVYLTGDSPNVLTSINPGTTYIIGGLVDHNRHKLMCLKRAQELGIHHAKLPISEHVNLNSRCVLAVNHVFEIILELVNCNGDWHAAFTKVIPARKLDCGFEPDT